MYSPNGPAAQDLDTLLTAVLLLFQAGGPVCAQGHARHAAQWHGAVLSELDQVENMDPQTFLPVMTELGLDNAAGLRALIRCSTAMAVASTLRHVLGRPEPGSGAPASAQLILDEINLTHWWLDG